jgi:hypothetical protein
MDVNCGGWNEGKQVPREARKLELNAGWRQVCQKVLVNEERLVMARK